MLEVFNEMPTHFPLFPFQERLSYIGPEEFVQAFVQKDPLDNDKVTSACFPKNTSADKKAHSKLCNPDLSLSGAGQT